MSSIKKIILAGGKEHYIQIDSSLDLEEVEITGSCSQSGKVVHISLSSLMKKPSGQNSESKFSDYAPQSPPVQSFDMFSDEPAPILRDASVKENGFGQIQGEITSLSPSPFSSESAAAPAQKEEVKKEAPLKDEKSDDTLIKDLFS